MSNYELNAKLVECYGSLEQLCNQIYNVQHGVTAYIDDMNKNGLNNTYSYKMLKEIRYKRNQLSHGEIDFGYSFACKEDIEFIITFKQKIINQNDPLTQHRVHTKYLVNQKTKSIINQTNKKEIIEPKKSTWQKIKEIFIKFK